jgi:hypothetical protein
MKKLRLLVSTIAAASALSLVFGGSVVFAGGPEPTGSFVCPVLGGQAGGVHGNSAPEPIVTIPSGSASVLGPDVHVPIGATNLDGSGNPGSHASPGEDGYSPIWWGLSGPDGAP